MTAATRSPRSLRATRGMPLWLAVVALVGALIAAAIGSSTTTPAEAYEPAPTPTATAEPAPTPIPEPTPTQEPALPPPPPNDFFVPPNPPQRVLAGPPGAALLPEDEAVKVPPRFFVNPPTPRLRDAPRAEAIRNGQRVPVYQARDDIRLLVSLPLGGEQWTVQVRRQGAGSTYTEVGTLITPFTNEILGGRTSLPVFNFSRKGTYIVALTNTAGETLYVKIVVGPAPQ